MNLVQLLIVILIFGVIFYALSLFPIAQPFRNLAYLVLLIIFVVVLLSIAGLLPLGTLRTH